MFAIRDARGRKLEARRRRDSRPHGEQPQRATAALLVGATAARTEAALASSPWQSPTNTTVGADSARASAATASIRAPLVARPMSNGSAAATGPESAPSNTDEAITARAIMTAVLRMSAHYICAQSGALDRVARPPRHAAR